MSPFRSIEHLARQLEQLAAPSGKVGLPAPGAGAGGCGSSGYDSMTGHDGFFRTFLYKARYKKFLEKIRHSPSCVMLPASVRPQNTRARIVR